MSEPAESTSGGYPPPPQRAGGRTFTIAGFVCAAVALLLLPIVLGPLGAILGYVGMRKGDPLGRWAILAGIAATVIGIVLAALLVEEADLGNGAG